MTADRPPVGRRLARWLYARLPARLRDLYVSHRLPALYALPNTVYLETTSACNLNCVMCAAQRPSTKQLKPSGFINPRLFRRLVDEIVTDLPSVRWLYLHKDGEPLLHPQIVDLIEYASARHPDVTLVTNATLLTEEISRAILATRLQKIRFSVDGLNRATFERVRIQLPANEYVHLRVPVSFDAVMANIERFLRLKGETGNRTLQVGLRTTDFKPTASQIAAYREYWQKRVSFVEVAELMSWSGAVGKEDAAADRHACLAPWASLVIGWDGTLVPCCSYIPDASGTGSLYDLESGTLLEALRAPHRRALMAAHLDGALQAEAPYCVDCRDWRSVPIPVAGRRRVLARLRSRVD